MAPADILAISFGGCAVAYPPYNYNYKTGDKVGWISDSASTVLSPTEESKS
jgi:hypothetical protein